MSRLVFWWLTCVPVLFSFSYLLVLYLRFFRVFFYSNFRLLCFFINFIYAQSVSFTCFTSSFVQLHVRLFCFQLCSPTICIQWHKLFSAFKLISLNVKGLRDFRKRRTIFLWCRKRKADLVFLQETQSIAATENQSKMPYFESTNSSLLGKCALWNFDGKYFTLYFNYWTIL